MPSPNAALIRTIQTPAPGELVSLYTIDLSTIGISITYPFTSGTDKVLGKLIFRGVTYEPSDIECDGFEVTSQSLPRPRVTISNVNRVMSSAAILHDDLIGARFLRLRTFRQFLDNGETPSDEAAFAMDIYLFDQKVKHNKHEIEWELAAAMDQEGRQLPGRKILRDLCPARYRTIVKSIGGSFQNYDYTRVQCPYNGAQAFDIDGHPTTQVNDVPSRKVETCCKARFGVNAVLPFWGFPGVARTRV